MVALIVILFPPLLIAFLLVMERVEEPLRRPTSQREVEDFLGTATAGEVGTLANSGIRRAMSRWRAPAGGPRPRAGWCSGRGDGGAAIDPAPAGCPTA